MGELPLEVVRVVDRTTGLVDSDAEERVMRFREDMPGLKAYPLSAPLKLVERSGSGSDSSSIIELLVDYTGRSRFTGQGG